jgi:RNA polymerase primary sigma factor
MRVLSTLSHGLCQSMPATDGSNSALWPTSDVQSARPAPIQFHALPANKAPSAKTPRLTADDERVLAARIRAGDLTAHHELVIANLPLVLYAVRGFTQPGLAADDLIQEGNLGLIKAAHRYDPMKHSTRFATYAACWIRAYLIRATDAYGTLMQVRGRSKTRRSRSRRERQAINQLTSMCVDTTNTRSSLDGVSLFLDDPINCFDRAQEMHIKPSFHEVLDEVSDSKIASPDQDLAKEEDRWYIQRALKRLSPFEAWVIRERFGVEEPTFGRLPTSLSKSSTHEMNCKQHGSEGANYDASRKLRLRGARIRGVLFSRSYVELARDCGLSPHRVQLVERTALRKLRAILRPRFHNGILG